MKPSLQTVRVLASGLTVPIDTLYMRSGEKHHIQRCTNLYFGVKNRLHDILAAVKKRHLTLDMSLK